MALSRSGDRADANPMVHSTKFRRRMGAAGVAVAVAAAALSATAALGPRPASASSAYERLDVPDTNYAVPPGALFVSPSGSDSNPGTLAAPLRTATAAVAKAKSGITIVLRAGTYRESLGSVYKRVTFQPYPHEEVWFKGSVVVSGWAATGATWSVPWTTKFCQTCHHWSAVDDSNPDAGRPDMVFFDGAPLRQVSSPAAVAAGSFYVDHAGGRLHVGSDPTGRVVESAVHTKAMQFNTTGAVGSIVRGIGFAHYAPYWDPATPAMVVANTAGVRFENNVFAWSASRGLSVYGADGVVTGNTFLYNGFTGFTAHRADRLRFTDNRVVRSNEERFSKTAGPAASAGGIKLTASTGVLVADNVLEDNWGVGLWFDESMHDSDIARNIVRRSGRHGIVVEISGAVDVVSNVAVDSLDTGLKISGSNDVRAYNNTVANNAVAQIGVYEDPRKSPHSRDLSLGITWDTADVRIANNIASTNAAGSSWPSLHTLDASSVKTLGTDDMITHLDADAYWRSSASGPATLAQWVTPTGAATAYKSLAALQAGTGREPRGWAADGGANPFFVDDAAGDYALHASSPARLSGVALPSDLAALAGVTAGVAVDRGALRWPGHDYEPAPAASPTTTTTAAPTTTTAAPTTTTAAPTTTTTTSTPPPAPAPTWQPVVVADGFSRSVSGGWGSAETGGPYTAGGQLAGMAADGAGRMTLSGPGKASSARLRSVGLDGANLSVAFSFDRAPTGHGHYVTGIARAVDVNREYQGRVRLAADGVYVGLLKTDGSPSASLLGPETKVPGLVAAPGRTYYLRVQAAGTGVTQLRARAWERGTPEPTTWHASASDTTASLQRAGGVGLHAAVSGSASTGAVRFSFDGLAVQTMSV